MSNAATFPDPVMLAQTEPQAYSFHPSQVSSVPMPSCRGWSRRPLKQPNILDGTRYEVIRFLGQGGMGEVYEVEHQDLGRRCVVKVLHEDHRGRRDLALRMRDEARTLATLEHPNLISVFDLGMTTDGRPYFAMDLLVGRDLRSELVRLGVIAVPTALDLICQALDGLAAVHDAGIVHRDVKLENLFLCDDGKVKVIDFGIAKVLGAGASVTRCGVAIGTPRSMAPEQCTAGKIDARTDLYAIGLALYELVTGRGPFDDLRGNEQAICFAHCERLPPLPSHVAPQPIPLGVEGAILKAISKSPGDRFQSAAEMAQTLRGLRRRLQGQGRSGSTAGAAASFCPDVASRDRCQPRRPRRTRSHPSRAAGAVPCVIACILSVVVAGLSIVLAGLGRSPAVSSSPAACTAAAVGPVPSRGP